MHWSWFSFVVGLLVAILGPVGVEKLKAMIKGA
jgi:hypothetical protein